MPILDHFKILAPHYDRFFSTVDAVHWSQILNLPISGWLLDAGGGTGRIAYQLAFKTGGTVVCDESMGMLRQATQKKKIKVTCCAVENLPYVDGFFDRIIMVDAFHHLEDQQQCILELNRVLRPGGLLVIEEPDIHQVSVWGIALLEKIAFMRSHFRSPDWICERFEQLGNRVGLEIQDSTFWLIVEKPV